jgi:hypothetical protein
MKYFLSFDCAFKTLAYSYIIINDDFNQISNGLKVIEHKIEELSTTRGEEMIKKCYELLTLLQKLINDFCNLKYEYIDVLNGSKLKELNSIQRTRLLKSKLNEINKELNLPKETIILIEDQPCRVGFGGNKTNMDSQSVSYQLQYEYCDYEIYMINPKLKQNVSFGIDYKTIYNQTQKKYPNKDTTRVKYTARKETSTLNFLRFIKISGQQNPTIKKIDDVADSFMQFWGGINHYF